MRTICPAVIRRLLCSGRVHPRRIHAWDTRAHSRKEDSVELMSANNKIYYSQIDVTNEDEVKAGVKAVVDSGAKRVREGEMFRMFTDEVFLFSG